MSEKPTIADLEKILDGPAQQIDVLPNGEIRVIIYSGLDKIQELEPNIMADTMGDRNIRQKVNEIIKAVNHMIDILNSKLR